MKKYSVYELKPGNIYKYSTNLVFYLISIKKLAVYSDYYEVLYCCKEGIRKDVWKDVKCFQKIT